MEHRKEGHTEMRNPREKEVEKWSKYYLNLNSFMQPNEYLLKLLLGNYEGKKTFWKIKDGWNNAFANLKCLDSACGDGRNIPLLSRLGFSVFATEISDGICKKVFENVCSTGTSIPKKNIKTGFNNSLPFENSFFDFLISWNAIYYLDHKEHEINENINEVTRVLKKGGYFIGSIPGPKCYSFLGAKKVGTHQVQINPSTNSNWGGGLQKDTFLYLIETQKHLKNILSHQFINIETSELYWDGFGSAPLHYFMFVAQKK